MYFTEVIASQAARAAPATAPAPATTAVVARPLKPASAKYCVTSH